MGFHDRFATNKAAAEEGTWVDLGDGVKIKVRRFDSAVSKAVRRKLEEPYTALRRAGQELSDDIAQELLIRQLAQAILVDWRGVTDEEGKSIAFSSDVAYDILKKYDFFLEDVSRIVGSRDTFKSQVKDADLGN
jgi:hypothetical protein